MAVQGKREGGNDDICGEWNSAHEWDIVQIQSGVRKIDDFPLRRLDFFLALCALMLC
jgi:hypothetical protein